MNEEERELTEEELFLQRLRNSGKYKAAEAWVNGTERAIDKSIEFLKNLREKIINYKRTKLDAKTKVKKR